MENVFEEIEMKYDEFYKNEIKLDLYYAVAYNADNDYMGEVNGYHSYCGDCKLNAYDELNNQLNEDRNELDIDIDESQYKDVEVIKMICESSPERDDFELCTGCGDMIYTGILHTFTQEIDHYLTENLKISNLSNSDCYRIHEILTNSNHHVEVAKLRLKILNDNK